MYIPLQLRLTLFYALLLALALWFFGQSVYAQATQRAYSDLDTTLSSRAASVQLGKFLVAQQSLPAVLPGVDGLGTGGVSIEVLSDKMTLIAGTTSNPNNYTYPAVNNLGPGPVPWDSKTAKKALQGFDANAITPVGFYSTITYQGQHVRVYTLANEGFEGIHIIQTARSEQDIEQSLANLRLLLLQGGTLVMIFALVGGWLITWGVLSAVRRVIKTAYSISLSRNFSQRVPTQQWFGRDELAVLATTFNEMLSNLEELYQHQQRFVADASHELRAPITSIRCNLDLLTKAPDLPLEETQAALQDARAEADRMGRLVNDLLLLTHADASALRQDENAVFYGYRNFSDMAQVIDLDSLILEVLRQYRPLPEQDLSDTQQERKGPRLLLQHITPVQVYGDADQLKQVLVALLDNALKYTPYEGSVSLSLIVEAESAIVKISDTGIGIAPEDLPHIFERFYRADRARSRERGGSGLGLAIVQSIVQQFHGSIEVNSTPGKGSVFTLKLPLVKP
ncbi:MAG: HAMP domain-containing sensor histidine kinase [Ktedonobacteraceae bacterium]